MIFIQGHFRFDKIGRALSFQEILELLSKPVPKSQKKGNDEPKNPSSDERQFTFSFDLVDPEKAA